MTIPNVVLGELIDPVTFGNAVVNAVNDHETELADRLPLSGGTLTGDLQVDGDIRGRAGGSASSNISYGFEGDTEGLGMYSMIANQWLRFAAGGVQRMQINPERVIVNNDLKVDGVIIGNLSFGIADGIDTADILDRADVATMPALDDEGVTTTDEQTDMVTVNEVVTALLAKVKQLEGRLAELEA